VSHSGFGLVGELWLWGSVPPWSRLRVSALVCGLCPMSLVWLELL
jgi:hypothetical protein